MQPSHEQSIIIDHIKEGKHVVVDAVAGSGKSTTVLMTAKQCPETHILQLTYNAMLRKEVQEKIDRETEPLKNVEVHTFHSLAVQMYDRMAYNDTRLKEVLNKRLENGKKRDGRKSLVILDEVQDMTMLYFQFVVKIIHDLYEGRPQIMILGDTKQSLYEYKGADVRFLMEANEIWRPYTGQIPMETCTLQTSFRITRPMADFINKVVLNKERMIANKDGEPVKYVCGTNEDNQKRIYGRILRLLEKKGTNPDDIFILAPSIKNLNVRKLENMLVEKGIPCFVAREDEELLDERVIKGKVVFSSYHSAKGRQRAYVFVLGFDTSSLYDKEATECPNTLYVACTRASLELFVLETLRKGCKILPFLTMGHHEMKQQEYIEFIGEPRSEEYYSRLEALNHTSEEYIERLIRPSELPKHHSNEVYDELNQRIETSFRLIQEKEEDIPVPTVIETEHNRYEDVGDLNGIAVPLLYSHYLNSGFETLLYDLCNEILEKETFTWEHRYLKNQVRYTMPERCETTEDYLISANYYAAVKERLYGKVMQIKNYNWFTNVAVRESNQRMKKTVGSNIQHIEFNLVKEEMNDTIQELTEHNLPYNFKVVGRVDAITESTVWEFKFVSELSMEHFLQVMIYEWIWKKTRPDEFKRFCLFNIRTNEVYESITTDEVLNEVMKIMILSRFGEKEPEQNDAFIRQCHESINGLIRT